MSLPCCRWQQKDYKGDIEGKREVQLFDVPRDMASYDPSAIPIEWRSWLNGHRRVPPTPDESAKCALAGQATMCHSTSRLSENTHQRYESIAPRMKAASM